MSLTSASRTISATQGKEASSLATTLAAGYSLALTGTVWDDLAHQGTLGLAGIAHLVIYLGFIVLLVGLVLIVRNRSQLFGAESGAHPMAVFAMAAGIGVVLAGVVVDLVWHGMNPDATETNMLLLPGHGIQHVGLAVGLAGAVAAQLQWRLQRQGQGR